MRLHPSFFCTPFPQTGHCFRNPELLLLPVVFRINKCPHNCCETKIDRMYSLACPIHGQAHNDGSTSFFAKFCTNPQLSSTSLDHTSQQRYTSPAILHCTEYKTSQVDNVIARVNDMLLSHNCYKLLIWILMIYSRCLASSSFQLHMKTSYTVPALAKR